MIIYVNSISCPKLPKLIVFESYSLSRPSLSLSLPLSPVFS